MTFCSEGQDKSKIITNVEKGNTSYTVNYFDDSYRIHLINGENSLEELEKEMINQAIERDKLMYDEIEEERRKSLILLPLSRIYQFFSKNKTYISWLPIFMIIYSLNDFRKAQKKLNELKKYRILLEFYKEIKENPDLLKLVKFDTIYYNDINIFSIDEFSLSDLKTIKKEIIQKKLVKNMN